MGGYGSGRWGAHSKATTVEECRSLDVNRWMREDIITPDARRMGIWIWKNSYTGKQTASLGYEVDTRNGRPWVRLLAADGASDVLASGSSIGGTPLAGRFSASLHRT